MNKAFPLSVKGVVLNQARQCLVLRRSARSRHNAGLWDLPGGKCDPGEPVESALAREVAEETGLSVRLTRVVGAAQSDLPDRVVAYLILEAEANDSAVNLSSEHDAYLWEPRHRLDALDFCPQLREFIRSYAHPAAQGATVAPRPFEKVWYQAQVESYRDIQKTYDAMAMSLEAVFKGAARSLGLECIVQARAKSIASFGEKILRPGKQYDDPVRELTDLCGARVITHTLAGVEAIGQFIRDNFEVDGPSSGNKLESLAASEFGYLSWHYIVSFKPGAFARDLVPEELVRPDLKAEVQVRTLLQHAWADIQHDLSYKSRFSLPRRLRREFARLAAVLEEADRDFRAIEISLAEYASSYQAYYTEDQLRDEREKLKIVLQADARPTIAHQLARMAIALGEWHEAVTVLDPFAADGPAAVLRDLGISLCKQHARNPEGPDFRRGQDLLTRAAALDPTDLDAHASLGGTWRKRQSAASSPQLRDEYRSFAKACYRQAYDVDPEHPYPVGNYIEYEIADNPGVDVVSHFRRSLQAASRRCEAQAEVGVNLPWADFDLGKFQLMLRQPHRALGYYARGAVRSTSAFFLDSALSSFPILALAKLEGVEWSHRFLTLAKAIRFGEVESDLPTPTPGAPVMSDPVVIVTECSDPIIEDGIHALLAESLQSFKGTLISSGTKGADSSPLEPLQYWADIHASGIHPDKVRLLAVGGGPSAALECQIALALGAHVETVAADGSDVTSCLKESPWSGLRNLHALPRVAGALQKLLST